MKEKYLRPAIVNANTLYGEGIIPLGASALLGGFLAARVTTKAISARPAFKLPSLTEGRRVE